MRFLCALCVLCGLASSGWSLDREAFAFTKYNLDVRIEPDQQRLAVRGTITLRNDSGASQKNLSLQISSSLGWRSIQFAGKPVQFVSQPYTSDIDHTGRLSEAIVTLPQEIPPKGTVELEIGYEGVVLMETTRLTRIGVPEETAKHTDWDEIGESFTAVRGVGYVAWYPVATEAASWDDRNSVFEVLGRWKARETHSTLHAVFSYTGDSAEHPPWMICNDDSGSQETYEQSGRAQHVTEDCVFHSLETTVPLFAMGRYERLDQSAVTIFYSPEHKTGAEVYAKAATKVAPFVTGRFGAAHRKVEVAELQDAAATSYESGAVMLAVLDAVDPGPAEIAAVHELTHAAFPSSRAWIYEGVAHFAQALYLESQSGRMAAIGSMGLQLSTVSSTEKALAEIKDKQPVVAESLVNTPLEEFYRSKAMYVWWMLRDMAGEASLKKALAAYRAEDDRDPSYVQHLIEAQTKTDLTWFFDDWVYHDRGLPDFRVDSAFPSQTTQGAYMVTVTIENLGGAGAEVPVTVRARDGEVTKRLVVRAKSQSSIRIVVLSAPQEVIVNDGSVPESDMSNNTLKVPAIPESH